MTTNGRKRHGRSATSLALLGAVAACCLAWSGALAQEEKSLCSSSRLEPKARIQACTTVIRAGHGASGDLAWAYNNRGADHVRQVAYDLAVLDLSEAIRLKPDYIAALNNRCYVLAVLGRTEAAMTDCNRSLQLQPNNYRALDSRGYTHFRAGRLDKAVADYNAALAVNPTVAASLYGRGQARLALGQKAAGLADLQKARELEPGIDKAMLAIGLKP